MVGWLAPNTWRLHSLKVLTILPGLRALYKLLVLVDLEAALDLRRVDIGHNELVFGLILGSDQDGKGRIWYDLGMTRRSRYRGFGK